MKTTPEPWKLPADAPELLRAACVALWYYDESTRTLPKGPTELDDIEFVRGIIAQAVAASEAPHA